MATLTPSGDLVSIRQNISTDLDYGVILHTKDQVNIALQTIENWFEDIKPSGSDLIDDATFPFVFTNPQKKILYKYWLFNKFFREDGGVI